MNTKLFKARRRQSGVNTLTITMLLLAVLTVAALFAASFGVFEQRTAASEYRHKLAFQAAEAGLNQAAEYIKSNAGKITSDEPAENGWFAAGSVRWQRCAEAKPASMKIDPCLAEPDGVRRGSMYRFLGVGGTQDGLLPLSEMFPNGANQTFDKSGGGASGGKFATSYGAYAALCRLDTKVTPAVCSTAPGLDGSLTITVVSRGQLTDESADSIVKQSFGTYRTIGRGPDAPLIAAVTVGSGNAQIVPNPQAGEPDFAGATGDEDLSIWAKEDADISGGGSFASCKFWAWETNFAVSETTSAAERDKYGVCFTCTCNNLCPDGLLSGNAASCPGSPAMIEGADVLDVDGGKSDATIPRRDSSYFPSDLFAYAFGVPSGSADRYLEDEATNLASCSELTADSGGLYWYSNPKVSGLAPPLADCRIDGTALPPGSFLYPGGTKQVGTLKHPVVLVSDGPVSLQSGVIFYGVIYIRAKAGTGDLLKATGSPQVYGSVVLEGAAGIAGTPTLVYNKAVLDNILKSPTFLHLAPVAGSWSDDVPR